MALSVFILIILFKFKSTILENFTSFVFKVAVFFNQLTLVDVWKQVLQFGRQMLLPAKRNYEREENSISALSFYILFFTFKNVGSRNKSYFLKNIILTHFQLD